MSITLNAKGTSVPSFKIGKSGVTIYQGLVDPSLSNTLNNNDYWFDSTTNALHVWSASHAVWQAPRLADLHFVSSSIVAPAATDLTLSLDAGQYVDINAGTSGPALITASLGQDIHINPAVGGGQYLYLNANQWPTADGITNQTLTTNGTGTLSFANSAALYLPSGSTIQRPSGIPGEIRFNSDNQWFEGYNGTDWYALSGSPSAAFFNLAYTYTGTLNVAPIAMLTPPPFSVNGYVADYSGLWASTFILASSNSALTSITFTNLQGLTGSIITNSMPTLTKLSMPALTTINGAFSISSMATITNMDFPSLTRVDGLFNPSNMPTIATFSLPALQTTGIFQPANMAALATLSMPQLETVNGDFSPNTMPAVSTFYFPQLNTVTGYFMPNNMAALPALSCPSLTSVGEFNPNTMAALAALNCLSLTTVSGYVNINTMAALPTLRLPALTTVGGDFRVNTMAALTAITISALAFCGGRLITSNMVALTTIDISSMVSIGSNITSGNVISITTGTNALTTLLISGSLKQVGNGGGNVIISSAVLSPASVDNLLIRLAALDGTNGTTIFSNRTVVITGTSGIPTATGNNAKNILIARGCSVTTN